MKEQETLKLGEMNIRVDKDGGWRKKTKEG